MRTVLRAVIWVGLPVSLLMFLGAAALLVYTDLPQGALPFTALLPLLTGSFFSGQTAARRLRKSGLFCGILAPLLLSLPWYAAHCLYAGALCLPVQLAAAVLCGICGAAVGLQKEAPKPRKRMHVLIRTRERLRLLPLLLHKPKKQRDAAQNRP